MVLYFFSWSFAIISEIKFEDFFSITKMIKTIQGNINLIIKLVIAQLQLLSLCAIIYYNDIFPFIDSDEYNYFDSSYKNFNG